MKRVLEQLNYDLKRLTANLQANSDALHLHAVSDLWHVTENLQALADQAYTLQSTLDGLLSANVSGGEA